MDPSPITQLFHTITSNHPNKHILGYLEIDIHTGQIIKSHNFLKHTPDTYIKYRVPYGDQQQTYTISEREKYAKLACNLWSRTVRFLPKDFGRPKSIKLCQKRYLRKGSSSIPRFSKYYDNFLQKSETVAITTSPNSIANCSNYSSGSELALNNQNPNFENIVDVVRLLVLLPVAIILQILLH